MKRFCHSCGKRIEKVGYSKQVICNPCKIKMLKKMEEEKKEELTPEETEEVAEDLEEEEEEEEEDEVVS